MKKKTKTAVVVLVLLFASAGFPSRNPDENKFVQLVKELAIPLVSVDPLTAAEDLDTLKDVIGNSPIVCLGESQHLMREQYQLKHRIIKFLVEEMDFTHIAIEDSFYGTIAIDDYIKGAVISPEEALKETGGWYLWDTEEMLSFVQWLRSHNDKAEDEQKVSYVGLDIQDPWPGIKYITQYFIKVDPEYAGQLENHKQVFEVFNKSIWFQIRGSYPKLTPVQKQEIEDTLKEIGGKLEIHKEDYIKTAGEKEFRDAVLVVRHLLKSHACFLELEDAEFGDVGIREKTMFANIVRIRESSGPQTKIIVWVHNAHAAKSPVVFLNSRQPESPKLELLGTMLKQKYGSDVKSIGMASLGVKKAGAEFQENIDVLDHVLSNAGLDLFFLDFDKLTSRDGGKDLQVPWKLTADMGGFLSLVPSEAYDGLFFIRHTTGVRPSKISAERYKKLF
ncbi:erythromycin esterase family protein [Acidobacteriota bacterium]